MIEAVVRWSLRHRGTALVGTAVLAVAGLFMGTQLRLDALPDVTGNQVLVLTRAPGFPPNETERLVTRPVEMALGGLPGSIGQRSISRYGLSAVTVLFDDDADLLNARQVVQERLQTVTGSLPEGAEAPELGPLTGGLGEIYQFTVSSPQRTAAQLSELVLLRVSPLLRTVPGVVEVNAWGGVQRTLDVRVDPQRLANRRVTLREVREAVSAATGQAPGGTLESGTAGVYLRGVAWPRTPGDLAAAVIRVQEDGSMLRLSDVAEVAEGALPRIGAATADGRGETVYVMVQMLLEANALDVLEGVRERMESVRQVLPPDVELQVVYDRAVLVSATLRTVFTNLLEGGLLVVAVLFLMLGSFRAGALVASIIPLAMLGAVAGMVVLRIPGNLMSLGALDFGLLVDGAVVMVEGVFLAVALRGEPLSQRVNEAATSMARPVFFSVMIILLVYVPILSLDGVEGKMFRPMAMTVVLALSFALLLTLVYVPAAASFILRPQDVHAHETFVVRGAARLYRPVLEFALMRPVVVVAVALLALALGGWLLLRAGTAFVPQLDEGDLVVQTTRESDIRVETAVAQSLAMEGAIARIPEVRHVSSRIGSPEVATDVMGLEQADVFVELAPRAAWRPGLSKNDLIAEIDRAIAEAAPALEAAFTQPIQMRFNELVGGSVTDVALSFFGEDLEVLERTAERAVEILADIPGAVDVRLLAPPAVPLLEVRPLPLEASRQGVTPEEILGQVQALRTGLQVGTTYDGPIQIPIRLLYDAPVEALTLESMPVVTAAGTQVPLRQVASVHHRLTPSLVDHEMGQRRSVVGFNVRGGDLGSVVSSAQRRLAEQLQLPDGVRPEWGGQYESLQSARRRLAVVIPAALGVIVVLLLALFRDVRPLLAILLNVPFAAVGGIVALTVRDLPVSISAAVGFIALSGIAVLNGVVLINGLWDELHRGGEPVEAARHAGITRMRPVLMTALVAALGFVPMMLATGPGAEVQRPLATVVVGGLISSTLLTLVILPTVVARFMRWFPVAPKELR